MCLSLKQYLSVADNARDTVLLHVSAASEKQERSHKRRAMMKTEKHHILTHNHGYGPPVLCFYTVEHPVLEATQYITHTH